MIKTVKHIISLCIIIFVIFIATFSSHSNLGIAYASNDYIEINPYRMVGGSLTESYENKSFDGVSYNTLCIGGLEVYYDLHKSYKTFEFKTGCRDGEDYGGAIDIFGDGKLLKSISRQLPQDGLISITLDVDNINVLKVVGAESYASIVESKISYDGDNRRVLPEGDVLNNISDIPAETEKFVGIEWEETYKIGGLEIEWSNCSAYNSISFLTGARDNQSYGGSLQVYADNKLVYDISQQEISTGLTLYNISINGAETVKIKGIGSYGSVVMPRFGNVEDSIGYIYPQSIADKYFVRTNGVDFDDFYGGLISDANHNLIDLNECFLGQGSDDYYVSIPNDSYITFKFPKRAINSNSKLIFKTTGIEYEKADIYIKMSNGQFEFFQTVKEDSEYHVIPLSNTGIIDEIKFVGKDVGGAAPGFDLVNVYILSDMKKQGTNSSSNSTSTNAPIISSSTLTYNGTNYDIFTQAVTIEKDSDIKASIEAAVNANGNDNVKVYITQGVGKEIDITGIKKELTPGKDFASGKTIYIMAVDEKTGKSTSKATKLKVTSAKDGSFGAASGVEGLNFKLGKDVGFTIPDSVPVFGGADIKWSFDFIPVTFEYDKEDDNKLNVVIGGNVISEEYEKNGVKRKYFKNLDFKKYKKDISHAARTQRHDLKDLRKYFDNDKGKKKNMNLFGGAVSGSGKGSTGGDIDFMGYAEMKYIDGQWKFVEGVVKLDAEVKYTYEGQIFIWVVPCYYEFGGGIGAGFEGKMIDLNPNNFTPQFEGYLSAKILGEIGGGVGISGVATAGAAGEGSLNIKTGLAKSYLKSWGEGSANFNVKVFGKTVAEKEFARGDFLIYETGNNKGLIKDNAVSLQSVDDGIYNIDINQVYENEPRGYAKNPMEWSGNEPQISLMSVDYTNKNLHKLADNIYTESAPQICEIYGKKIMVMQWDNTERADADRTMLVYSVYDEASGTWSTPAAVDDDGTADFYPCFNDGYLAWQNEKTTLTDDMTLSDIAKLSEICVSKWNGNGFDASIAITDNNTLDTQPSVAKTKNGASVIWTTNTANDIMGITGKNAIMQSDFDGTAWSNASEIKSNLNAITNITAGNVDNSFCIAYVCDDDNDLNTINDRDIRIINNGSEIQLTNNNVLDSNPVFADNKIYYYRNGNIVYSDIDGSNESTVFDGSKPGLTDIFVVGSNSNGEAAIWWTKAENNGAEVYASLYADNVWSDEIKVTEIGNRAKYPSGILNDNGSMVVAFNNGIEQENEIVKTDLYTISVNPSYDLELADAYFDEDTMVAHAVVKNNGELSVDRYTVSLADNQKTVTEPLKAGESVEVEIEYSKPADFSARTITMLVAMANGEEYNKDNNSAEFAIGHADIEVSNVAVNEDETIVSADISNIGYDNAGNVKVQLRDGSADGAVIEEKTVNLNVGAKENVEFAIDKRGMRFFDTSKQLYVTTQISEDEVSLGNNDGYVVVMSASGAADYETEILSYNDIDGKYMINSVARNNTDSEISCEIYTAVYSTNGVLKFCGKIETEIAANNDKGVDIMLPCSIDVTDTIKTFIWNGLTPLSLCSRLEVTE